MRKSAQRLGILTASVAAMAAVSIPSAQAATNPYTPESACHHDFGGSWSRTTDGHRTILGGPTTPRQTWGDVYLMWNGATKKNCVVALKSAFVGTPSYTDASLNIQGSDDWKYDNGYYKYYAAYQATAGGKCVAYEGSMRNPTDTQYGAGGREQLGNCGG